MIENTIVFSIFLIFFGAACLATVALLARQSLLIAYIGLGILLGPWGLRWVSDAFFIDQISDVGIVFLLFLLGLHLQPKNLLRMLKKVTSMSVVSLFIFYFFGFLVALLWQFSMFESHVIGIAMMFSSTIISLKLLPSVSIHHNRLGEVIIGVLLFQDLVAIAVLFILQLLTLDHLDYIDLLFVCSGLPALILCATISAQYILIPLLNRFYRVREYLFLLAIAWCLSLSQLGGYFGLSHEVGAFIAGVALANNTIAVYIAESLQPLRDFFLVLFFFSVGANFDLNYLPQIIVPALLISLALFVIKPYVFKRLSDFSGESSNFGWELGFRLGQVSEFSLLVAYIAARNSLISNQTSFLIQAITMISFFVSTYYVVKKYRTPMSTVEFD